MVDYLRAIKKSVRKAAHYQTGISWNSSYASLYFHHIGKTGGTSVDRAIRNALSPRLSYPEHGVNARLLRSAQKYRYFSGHMPWQTSTLLPQPCLVVTTIRDPLGHFLSTYKHLARVGVDHLLLSHRSTPLRSLDDYLSDTKLSPWTLNPQSFSVGRELNWLGFLGEAAQTRVVDWSRSSREGGSNFFFLYGSRDDDRTSNDLLRRAKRRLRQQNTIAIPVTKIDESLPLLLKIITGKAPVRQQKENVASAKQDFSPSDEQTREILSRTTLDQELYSYACGLCQGDSFSRLAVS